MNGYLEILFWTITVYLFASSVVHLINVLKARKTKESNQDLIKAVIYLAGSVTLGLLLLSKPFSIKKLTKFLRPPQQAEVIETSLIATTTTGTSGTGVGTSV